MHPYLFPFPFFLIIFLIHVPTSLCADDYRYVNCSQPFQCSNIRNIGYPFWGQNRSQYCGHPRFKLDCQGSAPEITIANTIYHVLRINSSSQTLTITREDYWNTYCPTSFVNTTLDFNLFSYASTTQNLTLFYDCMKSGLSNEFSCSRNGTNSTGYYATRGLNNITTNSTLGTCNNSVFVPVTQSAIQVLESSPGNLREALNGGFGLLWAANNAMCDVCAKSGGQCGYNYYLNSTQFTCYCSRGEPYALMCGATEPTSKINFRWKVIIGVGGIIVASIFLIFCFGRKFLLEKVIVFWRKDMENDQTVEALIRNCGSLGPKRYSYSEVTRMTNSFKDKLGQGGYGGVYKGQLPDGRFVAVKVLKETTGNGEEFINEVASISRTSHVNIVTLLGFCYKRTKRALIYEFMPNGSLDKFIYDEGPQSTNRPLEWKMLYQIAVGIARGLEYLHRGCNTRILHFDIKPHNILLDEDFCPKVSDFGLAKLCQRKDSIVSMLGARGTAGYIAPEVFSRNFGGVSHKSDVYSYGMMVLEMVGGRRKIEIQESQTSEVYFPDWIHKQLDLCEDLRLHGVMTEEEGEISRKMVLVGLWCIQTIPSDRPSMTKVLEMLEGSVQSLQVPPKPFLSSPPRPPQHSSTISSSTFLSKSSSR